MSSQFTGLADATGRVSMSVGDTALPGTKVMFRGMYVTSAGVVYATVNNVHASWSNGLSFDTHGRLRINTSAIS